MAAHTDFGTFEAMFEASGFTFESPEDFATIPDAEWDAFIASVTRFPDWKTMQSAPSLRWTGRCDHLLAVRRNDSASGVDWRRSADVDE